MWIEEPARRTLRDGDHCRAVDREVQPLHPAGRIFTIVLIVSAASTAAYMFTQIAQALVENSLREVLSRRAMDKQIAALANHVIVCGFGRMGHVVAEELARNSVPLVIVENDPAREPALRDSGYPPARLRRLRRVLLRAGIARRSWWARARPDSVFITLSARELNHRRITRAARPTPASPRQAAHQTISRTTWAARAGERDHARGRGPAEISRPRYGEEVDLGGAASPRLRARSRDRARTSARRGCASWA
jgi:voltage-gated potassium channel